MPDYTRGDTIAYQYGHAIGAASRQAMQQRYAEMQKRYLDGEANFRDLEAGIEKQIALWESQADKLESDALSGAAGPGGALSGAQTKQDLRKTYLNLLASAGNINASIAATTASASASRAGVQSDGLSTAAALKPSPKATAVAAQIHAVAGAFQEADSPAARQQVLTGLLSSNQYSLRDLPDQDRTIDGAHIVSALSAATGLPEAEAAQMFSAATGGGNPNLYTTKAAGVVQDLTRQRFNKVAEGVGPGGAATSARRIANTLEALGIQGLNQGQGQTSPAEQAAALQATVERAARLAEQLGIPWTPENLVDLGVPPEYVDGVIEHKLDILADIPGGFNVADRLDDPRVGLANELRMKAQMEREALASKRQARLNQTPTMGAAALQVKARRKHAPRAKNSRDFFKYSATLARQGGYNVTPEQKALVRKLRAQQQAGLLTSGDDAWEAIRAVSEDPDTQAQIGAAFVTDKLGLTPQE